VIASVTSSWFAPQAEAHPRMRKVWRRILFLLLNQRQHPVALAVRRAFVNAAYDAGSAGRISSTVPVVAGSPDAVKKEPRTSVVTNSRLLQRQIRERIARAPAKSCRVFRLVIDQREWPIVLELIGLIEVAFHTPADTGPPPALATAVPATLAYRRLSRMNPPGFVEVTNSSDGW